jgi:hypothetical protein
MKEVESHFAATITTQRFRAEVQMTPRHGRFYIGPAIRGGSNDPNMITLALAHAQAHLEQRQTLLEGAGGGTSLWILEARELEAITRALHSSTDPVSRVLLEQIEAALESRRQAG